MRIIQVYNTVKGENLKCGFSFIDSLKIYLAKSYAIHKKLTSDYKMYTDSAGFEIIKDIIDIGDIEVIEFDIVAGHRYKYAGKIQAQKIQTEPYLFLDLDFTLFEMPDLSTDVICEDLSNGILIEGEVYLLKIEPKGIRQRPFVGCVGFTDIAFKDEYIAAIEERYSILEKINITRVIDITIEEVLLQRKIIDCNKTISKLAGDVKFEHLRGGLK